MLPTPSSEFLKYKAVAPALSAMQSIPYILIP